MSLEDDFANAQVQIKTLTKMPSNEQLLDLYSLFKQGSVGDCSGKRPGMMDFKGRAKFDSWAKRKGISKQSAMERYVALVERMLAANN